MEPPFLSTFVFIVFYNVVGLLRTELFEEGFISRSYVLFPIHVVIFMVFDL